MVVRAQVSIISGRTACHLHLAHIARTAEYIKIAVHRPKADARQLGPHQLIELVCSGVCAGVPQGIEDMLPLSGVAFHGFFISNNYY